MLGVVVNTITVLVGSLIGLAAGRALPQRMSDTVMKGLGLCTLFIGITGMLEGENTLMLIVTMVLGAILGEGLDLDGKLQRGGAWLQSRFHSSQPGKTSIAEGFVSACLLFCVGAMTIVGSLESGLTGDHTLIFMKSAMDCVAAIIFASQMGIGVIFSAAFVLVYQGALTLLAGVVAPVLTDAMISEMSCVGSLIICGLALNMLEVTRLKVINYVPAIFLSPFVIAAYQMVTAWMG